MNRWIKFVNDAEQPTVTMGDEVDYWTPGYKDTLDNFVLDHGLSLPAVDDGWEGYTYEQGRGLFRWRNGAKEFVTDKWPQGDAILAKYNGLKTAKQQREVALQQALESQALADQAAAQLEEQQRQQEMADLQQQVQNLQQQLDALNNG